MIRPRSHYDVKKPNFLEKLSFYNGLNCHDYQPGCIEMKRALTGYNLLEVCKRPDVKQLGMSQLGVSAYCLVSAYQGTLEAFDESGELVALLRHYASHYRENVHKVFGNRDLSQQEIKAMGSVKAFLVYLKSRYQIGAQFPDNCEGDLIGEASSAASGRSMGTSTFIYPTFLVDTQYGAGSGHHHDVYNYENYLGRPASTEGVRLGDLTKAAAHTTKHAADIAVKGLGMADHATNLAQQTANLKESAQQGLDAIKNVPLGEIGNGVQRAAETGANLGEHAARNIDGRVLGHGLNAAQNVDWGELAGKAAEFALHGGEFVLTGLGYGLMLPIRLLIGE